MLCQKCGKYNATMHYTEIINDQKTELHLCSTCASLVSYTSDFSSILSGMLFGSTLAQEISCPSCGRTGEQIKSTGRVGCGQCYQTFSDILTPYIKKIHNTDTHIGHIDSKPTTEIDKLKHMLQKAISSENYEEAARLRDQIKEKQREDN